MVSPRRFASRSSAVLLIALAALAVGCQDYATTPTLPSAATHGSTAGTEGAAVITSPYTCLTSIATPGGQYRHGRLRLTFPKESLARDGSTMRYRYHGYASGAELDRQADCTIPRSAAAVAMMHRIFRVHDRHVKTAGETSDGGVTVLSTDIDGIVITACQYGGEYPNCSSPPPGYQEDPNPPATDCSTYCDPWSDDGNGSGEGEPDWYWATLEGNDEAPTYCHSVPGCVMYAPDAVQRQKIATEIAKMRTDGICGDAKNKVAELFASEPSRIKLWDGEVRDERTKLIILGDHQAEAYALRQSSEIHLSSTYGITSGTIVHEALHVLGIGHGDTVRFPDGTSRMMGEKSSEVCT